RLGEARHQSPGINGSAGLNPQKAETRNPPHRASDAKSVKWTATTAAVAWLSASINALVSTPGSSKIPGSGAPGIKKTAECKSILTACTRRPAQGD
ncbi:MAG TPA: hypothetical protein VM620_11325, partial [Hyphomicrobium sp.]|nr:hypothetical protein [Hyphomicrobium sp.]